ncbi:MAG: hypothetical protein H6831_08065 [Planctomycetes bacterium]|nr:hypothetical protein [Planctomycetota bacterium]MCB9904346.1 hypothetical protein [Planctomycetota bacterium]
MIAQVDSLLRARGRFAVGRGPVPLRWLALLLSTCGFLYGAAMGAFDVRATQSLYSGLKVPLLLACSTLVCLPNFFAVNTFLGLRDDFDAALRAVLSAQATVAVALCSMSPLILTVYLSSDDYRFAILMNGVFFALATLAGQWTLTRHYAPLVRSNPRHRVCRLAWILLYVFVAIQLAWVLRPFIGDPGAPTTFFRAEAWSNAYVVIVRDVLGW